MTKQKATWIARERKDYFEVYLKVGNKEHKLEGLKLANKDQIINLLNLSIKYEKIN